MDEQIRIKAINLELNNAVGSGNLTQAKSSISDGADVNYPRGNNVTLLHEACSKGYSEIAELLISKGADVNAKDTINAMTPLHNVILYGKRKGGS